MTVNPETEFETIMRSAFDVKGTIDVEAEPNDETGLSAVTPSVATLLMYHEVFLQEIVDDPDASALDERRRRFLSMVASFTNIEVGDIASIKKIRSFTTTDREGKPAWACLPYDVEVHGRFRGLWTGPWYDVPDGVDLHTAERAQYLRRNGLLAVLDDVGLKRPGERADLPKGLSLIPLNHRSPELYKAA